MASGNVGNVFRRPLFLYDPPPDVNTYPPPVLRVSVSDEIRKNRKSRKTLSEISPLKCGNVRVEHGQKWLTSRRQGIEMAENER